MGNEFLISHIGTVAVSVLAVWFSLGYLLSHTDAPKGLIFIRDAFAVLFFTKIFGYLYDFLHDKVWHFIDFTGQITVMALLIIGAMQIKKLTLKRRNILILTVVASASLSAVAACFHNVPLNRLLHYGIVGIGFLVFSFAVYAFKLSKRKEGFVFTSFVSAMLAVFYLIKIASVMETMDVYGILEPLLYIAMAFGMILISNNLLCTQIDVAQEQIDAHRSRLEQIVLASPFPIMISKLKDDHLLLINEKAAALFNIDAYSAHKHKTIDFYADPSDKNELIKQLEENPVVENFEMTIRGIGMTSNTWVLVSARVIDFNYEIAIYMAFQDITERKQKEIRLYDQATRDPLTGCYNRRSFDEMVGKEVYKARRTKKPFCVFMIDADHFKKVNDTYGHAAGDRVLKSLASCCRRTLRESDVISRFGGEEFVIFMPDTRIEMAFKVCDRLRLNIADILVKGDNGEDIRFTVSIGLVESTQDDDLNMENLLKITDDALYIAKKSGRNRVIIGEKGQNINIASEAEEVKPLVEVTKAEAEAEKDNVPLEKEVEALRPSLLQMAESDTDTNEPPLDDDDYDASVDNNDILYSADNNNKK